MVASNRSKTQVKDLYKLNALGVVRFHILYVHFQFQNISFEDEIHRGLSEHLKFWHVGHFCCLLGLCTSNAEKVNFTQPS